MKRKILEWVIILMIIIVLATLPIPTMRFQTVFELIQGLWYRLYYALGYI